MASVSSNYREIRDALAALGDTMRLNRKPKSARKTVGAQLLAVTAQVIEYRTVDRQQEPDGSQLARLRPRTLQRKAEKGYPSTISLETGEMMSMGQLLGEQEVTPTEASMEYGTDEATRRKAAEFSEGDAHQEPRPFYDLGRDGEAAIDDYVEQVIVDQQISELS